MQASIQAYYILLMLCKGTPLNILLSSGHEQGLRGWRALVENYDPSAMTRTAGILLELLNFNFRGDIVNKLNKIECLVVRYKKKSKDTVSNSLRIGVVVNNIEAGSLKQHLLMNMHRFDTWTSFRNEVTSIRTASAATASAGSNMNNNVVPMDIGAVYGKGGKGVGKEIRVNAQIAA